VTKRRETGKGPRAHPRVLVVDDDKNAGVALSRALRRNRFDVETTESFETGLAAFHAGFFDLVIADWDLAAEPQRKGDALFGAVRLRDWEVPMILLSGQLPEASPTQQAETLQTILNYGSVRFVERGHGYDPVIKAARDLLQRRDIALVTLIGQLRATKDRLPTSSGYATNEKILQLLLRNVRAKAGTIGALAEEFAEWEEGRLRRRSS
jgi:DNA-binding NtrC family response regulator